MCEMSGIRPLPDTAGAEDSTDGWLIDRYTGEKLADVQMPFKVGSTEAFVDCPGSLLLKAGQWNEAQFTVTNKGESKLKLKVGISHPSRNYGYTYEWYVDGLTNGDTTKELKPNEFETGVLHIKPPATPVDVGDYFVIWAEEVTIAQNLFSMLVAFWIVK
ncbi:MAG: hypothetical protein QMD21_07845 [Candidatus Thermoplasmatota archaeon]|nr:hypothetical protein [Candidatus Thermoplasmatota archaeon]